MYHFYQGLWSVDSFTVYVLGALVLAVAWFMREIVGSTMLAVISVPILMLAGLMSQEAFQIGMMTVSYDRDSNVVVTVGVGVLVGLLLVILGVWLIARMRESQARARKVLPVSPTDGPGRFKS